MEVDIKGANDPTWIGGQHMHPLCQNKSFFHVVGDQQHCQPSASPEVEEKILHRFANLQIQGTEGFIQQQDAGIGGKSTGNGHPLLHTAGEFARQFCGGVTEAYHLQEIGRSLLDFPRFHALKSHAEGNVLRGVQPGIEAVFLKHHAPVWSRAGYGGAVDSDAATARLIQAGDQAEDRALPGSRAAHQGHEVSGFHGERQAIEDQLLPETLAEVVDDEFHGLHSPLAAEPQQQPESHIDGKADEAEHDQFGKDLIRAEEPLGQLDALAKANFSGHQFSHHHQVP